jgi:hypothetical protein
MIKKKVDFSTFQFVADTINGKILEFPKTFQLRCDLVVPLYQDIVRQFDGNECIVARRVYLIYYQGDVFGTRRFHTMDEFVNYRNANCGRSAIGCNITFYGCGITFNGCQIINPN